MLIQPEEGEKESYDRFRGRLMIPIRDPRGRVIAFGGRILGDGRAQISQLAPDTSLFDKGRTLYNLDRAGPGSRTARRLIVVEGYMDVIALDRAGIAEVVAPNGTALTEGQLERLWRLDPSPILCFDGDNAGQKAAIRAATRALPLLRPDRTLRFVELPAGQDPDDVDPNAGGREAFEALLASPEPLDARLWRHELDAEPLTTPEAWAGPEGAADRPCLDDRPPRPCPPVPRGLADRFFAQRRPAAAPRRAHSRRRAAATSRTAASSRPNETPAMS